ncbi:MAG: biotin--[acetyl-CoA-carboxylase] ligase [bacterium]|nr:biotin--[acetyl-CoA-carboxylase] ligase [bacterium]
MTINKNLISSNLETDFIGRKIHIFDELPSTNERAHELATAGASEGTVVIAESQTSGKGRRGRDWFSPPGLNIYTSIILRPAISPEDAPKLTLVAAVALAEAIIESLRELGVHSAGIKWPNDILIKKKKCAGILTEMKMGSEGINFVIIGIGINVNMALRDIPMELITLASSLSIEANDTLSREGILQSLYSKIENWYKRYLSEGFLPVKERWEMLSLIKGAFISAASSVGGLHAYEEGEALGLDDEGNLLIKKNDGNVISVITGDITIL